jgi:hypothetical protein
LTQTKAGTGAKHKLRPGLRLKLGPQTLTQTKAGTGPKHKLRPGPGLRLKPGLRL